MKKVICAVAAFAMVAGVATVVSAEVDLSGSARFRLKYVDTGYDINGVSAAADGWDSRVRVKFAAKTEGGGYIKARLRFLDGGWGNGFEDTPFAKGGGNVWSDYAFVGFKKGKFDVAGGKMRTDFSPWFVDDERRDRFRVLFKEGALAVAVTYDNRVSEGGFDDDLNVYGVTYRQKFSDAVSLNVRAAWVDNNVEERSDFKGSANVVMNFGGHNITIEQSYKGSDSVTSNNADDQYGGYAEWQATFGSITPKATIGYTADGFSADESFGWLMIGGDVPTSRVERIGTGGDTVFAGLSSEFQTSEDMAFQANIVYMDVDGSAGYLYGENPLELSGQMKYQLGTGVEWLVRAGYLSNDTDNVDDALAAYTQVEVKF